MGKYWPILFVSLSVFFFNTNIDFYKTQTAQWPKSPKNSLKECVFCVKNTLIQTAFSANLPPGCKRKYVNMIALLSILFSHFFTLLQVVAEHALTVPVTKNLNRRMRTFLPVHCVHQLLKSRVFTKHSISVKEWLFKQVHFFY